MILVGGPRRNAFKEMEPRAGLEPATCRLRIGCSTTELPRPSADSTIVNFTETSSALHDRCILLTFRSAYPSRSPAIRSRSSHTRSSSDLRCCGGESPGWFCRPHQAREGSSRGRGGMHASRANAEESCPARKCGPRACDPLQTSGRLSAFRSLFFGFWEPCLCLPGMDRERIPSLNPPPVTANGLYHLLVLSISASMNLL